MFGNKLTDLIEAEKPEYMLSSKCHAGCKMVQGFKRELLRYHNTTPTQGLSVFRIIGLVHVERFSICAQTPMFSIYFYRLVYRVFIFTGTTRKKAFGRVGAGKVL